MKRVASCILKQKTLAIKQSPQKAGCGLWIGMEFTMICQNSEKRVSPGESRPGLFTMYQLHGMQDSTKKGKVTFFFTVFKNQEASWIIN